ncbi:putative cysteine-rich receptor-like protein kinase 43 [Telopea speciosissima]|uniref:putative cysteine-rich receptor-like protein kinase 43 n=1 Tax=Telopea speciosissima TaxID=54955 RepID=UPI001CC769F4|nr:putative cysteine-rich receptor-like protein kinase 43 [Telopea speciosissima]
MVRTQIRRSLFGFGINGEPPDRVYLMAQCHFDLTKSDCLTCFQTANEMLSSCIPFNGGRIFLDGCFMRSENYSFYNDPSTFSEKGVSEKTEVSASAICWKLTDKGTCHTCLKNAKKSILHCLPKTEARVVTDDCFLRYADYPFFNPLKKQEMRNSLITLVIFILVIGVGSVGAIAIGVVVGCMVHARIHRERSKIKGIGMNLAALFKSSLNFKYSTLEKATQFFNEMNKLGEGASGEVFKGCLADGREIAVKRLFISYKSRSDEIYNEMYILTHTQHKNLVRFLGCCLTNDVTLFVYEFFPNKSLDNFLFDPEKRKELDWKKRSGIIMGTAEGIQYLHNDCECLIVHRDIKASNILLDLRYRPKIADFGLARFCSKDMSLDCTPICGTLGYMAPEYLANGQLSEKIDVYSFGILVLEIVSGIMNSKFKQDESLDTLVTIAWKHFQSNTVKEIIDEYLEIDDMEHVIRVIHVGLLCTQLSPSLRPTMAQAIEMLIQKDLDLPTPSKPPFVANSTKLSHPLFSCENPSEPILSNSCKPRYSDCETQ